LAGRGLVGIGTVFTKEGGGFPANKKEEKMAAKASEAKTPEEYRKDETTVLIRKLSLKRADVRIEGLTPLVVHAWSSKAKEQLLANQQGGKRRIREKREPEQEFEAARYRLSDGTDGIPVVAIKASITEAAHKDLGVSKVSVRRALFIEGDEGGLVRLDAAPPLMREDIVRVGMGSADLRYRPQYNPWALNLRLTYDADLLNAETVFNLIERAGFGGGLGEWRPEKGGEWGRFQVARSGGMKDA